MRRGMAFERHRIGLTYEAEAESVNVEHVIDDVLKAIPIP